MVMKDKVFFPNLDGLRFFAFLLVFLQHGFGKAITFVRSDYSNLLLRPFIAGEAGVSFFFVLSGFLITYLILTEISLNGQVDIISFYIRRALRIFPLYFLVVIWGTLVYSQLKTSFGFPDYIAFDNPLLYFIFLSNFDVINIIHKGIMGALSTNITWSVAVEEQFYLVWASLFYLLKPNLYKYFFPFIIIGSLFFRFWYRDDSIILYFHTFSVISDMSVGGGCAYLAIQSSVFREFFYNLKRKWIVLIYVLGLIVFWFEHQLFTEELKRFVPTIFYAFIILEQNYSSNSFFKMKNFKNISSLGKYTYGLYLLHPIAIHFCDITARLLKINTETFMRSLLQGLIAFFLSIVLSYYCYHFIEKKFLKLKNKFSYIQSGG